jgi:hypothetical protein
MKDIDYQNDICIWFIEGQEIGHREHHFDWEEGDTITTDGKKTEIYAIVKNTPDNVDLLYEMFHQCDGLFRGAKLQKQFFRKELLQQMQNPARPSKWFKGINMEERDFRSILRDKYQEVDEKTFDKVFEVIDECLEEVEV